MASLADLQQHLNRFWALPYHEDLALNDKLSEVQAWQRDRIQNSQRLV
ncbi:hypothetical protein [Psychrobacter sp. WY6]